MSTSAEPECSIPIRTVQSIKDALQSYLEAKKEWPLYNMTIQSRQQGGGYLVMSGETILHIKDLTSAGNSAKESLSKSLNLDWKANFLKGINIHYCVWSTLLNQEETWNVWLHKDVLCMSFLNCMNIFFYLKLQPQPPERGVTSEIESSSPLAV